MKSFYKIIFIILLFFIPTLMSAQSINILINQQDGIQENVRDTVQLFENSIMDFLFDAGCIVSSEKITLEKDITKSTQAALDASVKGYIDFLVIAKVNVNAKSDELIDVQWEIIEVDTSKRMGSGSMKAPKPYREKEVSIQRFGIDVGAEIYSCVKKR